MYAMHKSRILPIDVHNFLYFPMFTTRATVLDYSQSYQET
jgi:hypothetical protein